jgi:hypothetical protein
MAFFNRKEVEISLGDRAPLLLNFLRKVEARLYIPELCITSAIRTFSDQARIMWDLSRTHDGFNALYNMYTEPGKIVLRLYQKLRSNGGIIDSAAIATGAAKIEELFNKGMFVSKHLFNPKDPNRFVFDIPSKGLTDSHFRGLKAYFESLDDSVKVIDERNGTNNCMHVELPGYVVDGSLIAKQPLIQQSPKVVSKPAQPKNFPQPSIALPLPSELPGLSTPANYLPVYQQVNKKDSNTRQNKIGR